MTPSRARHARGVPLAVFATACLAATLGLFWSARHAVRLSANAPLPAVRIQTPGGARVLRPVAGRRSLVVLFTKECIHCRYELDAIARSLDRLGSTTLYLLTTDGSFQPRRDAAAWPALRDGGTVVWGQVQPDEWSRSFGRLTVPSLYLFDVHGRLVRSYRGETRIDALLSE